MQSAQQDQDRRTRSDRRSRKVSPLAVDLLGAIQRGEIEVLFQPQFACDDGAVVGAEALARWRHPKLGSVGAETLFVLAEQTVQVSALSRHIAEAALSAAASWAAPLRLSLNVTAADLAESDFADSMAGAVASAGLSPERLTVEITEQSLVADLDGSAGQLQRLATRGIHIALDDFGAGFCNFSYLKRLPLHALKLDRSMIEGIADSARDLAVLRGIIAMAQALELEVIAEGIEREDQRIAVAREGCAAWQGFLGAEPMTAAQFADLAAR